MGVRTNTLTIQIAELCIEANRSSHFFNQEVELHGLETATMNGKRGIARGYMNGRRGVYVFADQRVVAIKPENLRLVAGGANDTPINLVDVPDRLGDVALHELMTNQVHPDVAEKLIFVYNARIDIEDFSGASPKSIASEPVFSLLPVTRLVKKAIMKQGRAELKAKANMCRTCGTTSAAVSDCAACKAVSYCSRECQTKDWKQRHKKECKELAEKQNKVVVIRKSMIKDSCSIFFAGPRTGTRSKGFQKPSSVAVGEEFYIKVQCGMTKDVELFIYDKTRECDFLFPPGNPGFDELFAAARADKASQGRKTYVKASFDAEGNMTVWPGFTTVKTW